MARIFRVYLLSDPRDGTARYVGCTSRRIETRLCEHLSKARSGSGGLKNDWVREVLAAGHRPIIHQLEVVDEHRREQAESAWIARYRAEGAGLTNLTDGGDGSPGWVPSAETRALMGANTRRLHTGRKRSEEARARMREAQKAIPSEVRERTKAKRQLLNVSEETRAKLAAAARGKKLSPEHRAKIAERNRNASRETRAKLAAAVMRRSPEERASFAGVNKGRKFSEEHRRRLSESRKAYWARVREEGKDGVSSPA